jgi:hypothetical protein
MPLVFVPLVFYALVATFFVAWAVWKVHVLDQQNPQDLFKQIPDDGDDAGVTKDGKKITFKLHYDSRFATAPLPPDQRVALGGILRVGALEVTPTRVERRRVQVFVEGFERPEPCLYDSLVLHLKLRNVSADQTFAPLDNYFDRHWRPPGGGVMPLTQLEAGKDRFCGGPAEWHAPGSREKKPRQWVEGRKRSDPVGLAPGTEDDKAFVCTDGNDARAARVLFGEKDGARATPYPGPFLWRVELRRGLVPWRGRERSAATVIGVTFGREDFAPAGRG